MQILYHSDIISKIYGAFTTKSQSKTSNAEITPEMLEYNYSVLESLAVHRIGHLYTKEGTRELIDTIPNQVAGTVHQYCGECHGVDIAEFKPEDLNNETIKKELLELCSKGTFVPFLTIFTHDTMSMTDDLLVIIFGIGEHPDENFGMMCINIPEYIKDVDLSDRKSGIVMYPRIYDVPKNIIGALAEEPKMHIRLFTNAELEERIKKEQEGNNESCSEATE